MVMLTTVSINQIFHVNSLSHFINFSSRIIKKLPLVHHRYKITIDPETGIPSSDLEHDAGEFFNDLLYHLVTESQEVAKQFSFILNEKNGKCLEYLIQSRTVLIISVH